MPMNLSPDDIDYLRRFMWQQQQPTQANPSIGMFGAMNDNTPPDMIPSSVLDNYDYRVDIEKRDVFGEGDDEKAIGWDKTVTRYKIPRKDDLTDEGMALRDSKKKRRKKQAVMLGQYG